MRRLLLILITIVTSPYLFAQQITGIQAMPDPACRNQPATISVTGVGQCQQVSIQVDPNVAPQTVTNAPFPVSVTHTYTAVGTYTLAADSSHPNCSGGPVSYDLSVQECTGLVASEWVEHVFEYFRPEITGGWGLVQPGNPFPIVVFGEKFGATGGQLLLHGDFGTVVLTPLEWGADGKFASAYVPDVICGVFDHQASLQVVTADGWYSEPWPVNFTAKRETAVVPRSEVETLACGHDSNKDCCNNECDPDDTEWFSAGCTPNASFCGTHLNVWAAIGDDAGLDRYRVDLSDGAWEIAHTDFSVDVDPGEGSASLTIPDPTGSKIANFHVNWVVSPSDDLAYQGLVHMSGPCGTSHKPGFSQQALTGVLHNIAAMAAFDEANAAVYERLRLTDRQVQAAQVRTAAIADQRTQQELARLRQSISEGSMDAARRLDQQRSEAAMHLRRASSPSADEAVLREGEAFWERVSSGEASRRN